MYDVGLRSAAGMAAAGGAVIYVARLATGRVAVWLAAYVFIIAGG
jgi:hypothetical protein